MRVTRVILVEDDSGQRPSVLRALDQVFPDVDTVVFTTAIEAISAAKAEAVPFAQLAVIDRLLTWSTVDDLLAGRVSEDPPSHHQRGQAVANAFAAMQNRPRLFLFLSVLRDHKIGPIGGIQCHYAQKDASLDDFRVKLRELRDQ